MRPESITQLTLPLYTVTIPLTKGKVAIVDACDAERVMAHKWSASYNKGYWYAQRTTSRLADHRRISLHRFIMDAPTGVLVDHADGDGLNCRRSNMRFATKAQNQANSPGHKVGISGYRGVIRYAKGWRAQMTVNNRRKHIGCFATREEAARAYDDAVRAYWGEFAVTNF